MSKQSIPLLWGLLLAPFPGISHLLLKNYKKGLALLVIFCGAALTFSLTSSYLTKCLAIMIYVAILVPSFLEILQTQFSELNLIDADSKLYVIVMLLMTGFNALPLLWQNDRFSKLEKQGWSLTVTLLAVAFFAGLARYWHSLDSLIEQWVKHTF